MAAQNTAESIYGPNFQELTVEHFKSAIPKAIENYKTQIQLIKNLEHRSWDNSIQPLEEAEENLGKIWGQLEHLNAVSNTNEIRTTYDELLPLLTNFQTELMQDSDLYKIYLDIYLSPEYNYLAQAQRTIISNAIRDFKLCGVDLPEQQRQELKAVLERLSELENNFSNNVLDATEAWNYKVSSSQQSIIAGIPKITLNIAREKAKKLDLDGWVFTLDFPCYYAIMSNAKNRDLRREFYYAYTTRASEIGPNAKTWDNTPLISEILKLRDQAAKITGYDNYVAYSLVPKMATSLEEILKFVTDLLNRVKPKAQKELQQLQEFAARVDGIDQLEAWDIPYYSELYKIQNYEISDEALRQYFPEPRVLAGLFKLAGRIFGLKIEETQNFAKWHPSVRMFKVTDRQNKLRGYFYTDLYTREGKRSGAWMAECFTRTRFANNYLQAPIAFLNCNFAPPTGTTPGLLTHDDVITLFHEFGHVLHHILTQIDYYSASGMNGVAWDAVELPSQFMENWCWKWDVIQDISENIQTGEPLSRALFDKLLATKNYQSALGLLRQLEFTLFDLRIHSKSEKESKKSAQEIMNDIRAAVSVTPTPSFNRFQNSFSHIFSGGYAAGYYSYIWAEVLACDAYALIETKQGYDDAKANRFLTEILEMGGSKPALDLFKSFAGREPEVDALLEHHAIA